MRKLLAISLALGLLLCGCASWTQDSARKQYSATFLELFDTVTTVVGQAESKETFEKTAYAIRDELQVYHQLFDIYHDYPGINNLKTVNDRRALLRCRWIKKLSKCCWTARHITKPPTDG